MDETWFMYEIEPQRCKLVIWVKLFLWMNFDNMDEIELEIDLKGKINTYEWKLMTQIKHTTWMKLMHKGTIPYMDEIAHGRR
jgi:hypothetical protein